MTVKELKEILSEFDDTLEIYVGPYREDLKVIRPTDETAGGFWLFNEYCGK